MTNKLYYETPYISKFRAEVTSCKPGPTGFEIALSQTAFYPEGGGQPSDTGHIGEANISHVTEKEGELIHIADKELTAGKAYHCCIDWGRRFIHMQQHTAEHIISGIINKLYGADNVGFRIGENYVSMDYNAPLTKENIERVELLSNEAIYKNINVNIAFYDHVPEMPYRSKKDLSGVIRLVSIEDYDVCACCGTQLKTTGEIGLIKITSGQKYKGGTRLFMVCGYRALYDYRIKEKNVYQISNDLSAKPEEASAAVTQLLLERDELKHQLGAAKYALLAMKAQALASDDIIYVFEDNLSTEEMKKYHTFIMDKTRLGAVFTGDEENGYRYIVSSKDKDLSVLAKELNARLNGKGGGKGVILGSVAAKKADIAAFMNRLS